jgi:hypothetical protein
MDTYTIDDLRFQLELRRCAPLDWNEASVEEKLEAFTYFCHTYVKIRHPERGQIPFDLRDSQVETVQMWLSKRYTIALKARQVGFSTLVSIYAFWLTFFWQDRTVIMVSRRQEDSALLLEHAKYAYSFLPDWMRLLGPMVNPTLTVMKMSNNSTIRSEPSASNPARGATAFTIVVDEMGQLPNSHEAWASIEPVSVIGGRIIMLGTANGEGNLFHELWVGANNGTNMFRGGHIFHSWRAGGHNDDWYEAKKADLPPWQLHQEYPDNADEAFLRSGRPVFDVDRLRENEYMDPLWRGYLRRGEDGLELIEDGGNLRVWTLPIKGHRYCIGADVAEGLDWGDYSCAYVYDAHDRKIVAKWHGHVAPDLFGSKILKDLGDWYFEALVGVENNNHGLTTLKYLQGTGYQNIYRQRREAQKNPQATEMLGWKTTAVTKPVVIDQLAALIRDCSFYLPCSETAAELRTFVREGDGKMHGSPHDDRTMALAITLQMTQYVWLSDYTRKKPQPGPGTIGHFVRTHMPSESAPMSGRLGSIGVRRAA